MMAMILLLTFGICAIIDKMYAIGAWAICFAVHEIVAIIVDHKKNKTEEVES